MQNNKLVQAVKATISSIIVALLITGLLLLGIELFFGQKIKESFILINKVSITKTPPININKNSNLELNMQQ